MFTIFDIIEKKKSGAPLTKEEIDWLISGFVDGSVLPEQMSAFLMAVLWKSMTAEETYNFTKAMQSSGKTEHFDFYSVDKHSTGGVSDSTTLILVPILASLGIKIGKMSGRSLGFTGGTIDKLEVFEGYNVSITMEEFVENIHKNNCAVMAQTSEIALADKKIYALRDKTGTVESIPLIASSIMSKKLACGAKLLLLNVHFGSGAFMKNRKDAIRLAKCMIDISKRDGMDCMAVVSNMDTPLASGVGCVDEVKSVLKAYDGEDSRLRRLSIVLAEKIVSRVKGVSSKVARDMVEKVLSNGEAFSKLKQLISSQGGNVEGIDNPDLLQTAKHSVDVKSIKSGYVQQIDALSLAKVVSHLKSLDIAETLKKSQGLDVKVQIGDKVSVGDTLLQIHTSLKNSNIEQESLCSFTIGKTKKSAKKLVEKFLK